MIHAAGHPERSPGVRAGRGKLLRAARLVRRPVAVLLFGDGGCHLLRLGPARRDHLRRPHPRDGGPRRHLLPRALQRREGCRARARALGLHLLLLRRVPGEQEKNAGGGTRDPGFCQ